MGKRERYFQKVEKFKDKFRNETLEALHKRHEHLHIMFKEARVALREIIEEKKESQIESTEN